MWGYSGLARKCCKYCKYCFLSRIKITVLFGTFFVSAHFLIKLSLFVAPSFSCCVHSQQLLIHLLLWTNYYNPEDKSKQQDEKPT